MEDPVLTGVASDRGYARLTLRGLPPEMTSMTTVLTRLTGVGISVDLLAQLDTPGGRRDLQLTVAQDELDEARAECQAVLDELGGDDVDVSVGLARVTLVGSGMHGRPGVFARAFETLRREGVEVHAVSASSVSITLMVDALAEARAVAVLHEEFGLGEETG